MADDGIEFAGEVQPMNILNVLKLSECRVYLNTSVTAVMNSVFELEGRIDIPPLKYASLYRRWCELFVCVTYTSGIKYLVILHLYFRLFF